MALSTETLKQLIEKAGLVEGEDWKKLELDAKRSGLTLERLLIARGLITPKYLNELLSEYLNVPVANIDESTLTKEVMGRLPEATARQRKVVVFKHEPEKNVYHVAMEDPTDVESINFLREYLKGEIQPYIAAAEILRTAYRIYKKKGAEDFEKLITQRITDLLGAIKKEEKSLLESLPLVQLFDTIVDYAATLNASDIFFMPQEDLLLVRFRIDGVLNDIITMDKSINDGIVARAKILSNLRIDEHMKPQDGRFRFKSGESEVDIRTAVIPSFFGEKVTLRLLSSEKTLLTLEELGANDETAAVIKKELARPYGMILSTGPTGSGKTTTIYAMLNILNRPEVHIVTVEDPVEYLIPRISQTQVNPLAGITFASGLRSMLRHSPDIIVVGEIRDAETAEIAIHSALTGHLLISTLHTNDAVTAIPRLIDLGIPPFLVAATVNAIIAQRLVRRICKNCAQSYTLPQSAAKILTDELKKASRVRELPKIMFRGAGCIQCGHTGYVGRVGIFEVLKIDEKVRELIASKQISIDRLKQEATRQGMLTMLEDGLVKTEQGITTIEEVLRVVRE